ncbi:hypothetical protein ARMGADRAFT_281021 [Armillaria gallica]|uniref:Carbohydrate esterase family 16 protein n=1 Tax=Armillaria gallica TaxID=47427 RepID=A0A2H3EWP6_ARMGA|nr:hypothetical protein ARMGADRAFT_281021 [Armillaria gallica]
MIKSSVDLPVPYRGSHWCGESSLGNIAILGDSYSKPDLEEESAVWVDHLLKDTSICVHNLAFPSVTVEDDLHYRDFSRVFPRNRRPTPMFPPSIRPNYLRFCTSRPFQYVQANRLVILVSYLGINDCGSTSADVIVEALFGAVHDLYVKTGARNFVLVDVPPIDRSPGALDSSDEMQDRVETWNGLLGARTSKFATSSPQATVFVFSSHNVLTDVLDDPLEYDFGENDPDDEGGAVWEDDLHLTPAVHAILADRFLASLKAEDQ